MGTVRKEEIERQGQKGQIQKLGGIHRDRGAQSENGSYGQRWIDMVRNGGENYRCGRLVKDGRTRSEIEVPSQKSVGTEIEGG